jgi:kynurenine formamidase
MATVQDFRRMADKVRNWGRWGEHDELGTLNLITEDKVREAATLVRQGKVIPLGINFDDDGPQGRTAFRTNPIHHMTVTGGDDADLVERVLGIDTSTARYISTSYRDDLMRFNDDYLTMPLQAATQWDALSHIYYEGQMYNGFSAGTVTSFGASKCSIDKVDVKGIVSRGVLLDVAGARGVDTIDPALPSIAPEELDAVAKAQGVQITPGDIVLVRTGWWTGFKQTRDRSRSWNGLGWLCAEWLRDLQVAAVAADNIAVEGGDQGIDMRLPLHLLCLRDMGMMLGEIWDLDGLAADCAADGVYEFQLVAPPLRVTGAVGSPINPLALK